MTWLRSGLVLYTSNNYQISGKITDNLPKWIYPLRTAINHRYINNVSRISPFYFWAQGIFSITPPSGEYGTNKEMIFIIVRVRIVVQQLCVKVIPDTMESNHNIRKYQFVTFGVRNATRRKPIRHSKAALTMSSSILLSLSLFNTISWKMKNVGRFYMLVPLMSFVYMLFSMADRILLVKKKAFVILKV